MFGTSRMAAPPKLGTRQILEAYSTMPWLRAVTNKVSWEVGTTRWQLFTKTKGGSKILRDEILAKADFFERERLIKAGLKSGDVKELDAHPMLDFLAAGPPSFLPKTPMYFNGTTAMQLTQTHLDLVGEAPWILERDGLKTPTNWSPMPPNWLQEVPNPRYPMFRFVSPYGTREMDPKDVAWFYHPDPSNPYKRGTGTGMALADELETDKYLALYLRSFFFNDAKPPFMVSVDGADSPELKRLDSWWQQKHSGRDRWWKPAFIGKKVDVHELGNSLKDNGVPELRKAQRDVIIQVYGVSPEVFGINESSNRAVAETAQYMFQSMVKLPRCEFLRTCLQDRIVPEFDDRLIVGFPNPVSADKAYELDVMKANPAAYFADDFRVRSGHEELPGGDGKVHLVPFNVTAHKTLADAVDVPAPVVAPKPVPAAAPKLVQVRQIKGIRKSDLGDLIQVIDTVPLGNRARQTIESTVEHFGSASVEALDAGVAFNLKDPRVTEFISNWAGDRIKDLVDETTKESLKETLAEGIDEGESFDQLKGRITDVFSVATDSRAANIARTETTRASGFATNEGMRQAGVERKSWLATDDGNVRDTHAEMDGQIVDIDDEFESPSGATAGYPGDFGDPAEDCNCRCGVLPEIEGESAAARSGRRAKWTALEAARKPFDRKLASAMRAAFADQKAAILSKFSTLSEERGWNRTAA